jgi:hypothetical protein
MRKEELIGKTITNVYVSEDGSYLKLSTPNGYLLLQATGDCCSHSWIENVDLFGSLSKVESIDNQELRHEWEGEENYGDLTRFYGMKIKMERGTIDIDYRNSSNGYYGGDLSDETDWDYAEPDIATVWKKVK